MKIKPSRIMVLFGSVLTLFMSGCAQNTPPVVTAGNILFETELDCDEMDYDIRDINKSVKLELMEFVENTLQPGTEILLEVKKTTSQDIFFPAGFNLEIRRCANGTWEEVKNSREYLGDVILSENGIGGPFTGLTISPGLRSDEESLIRVFIQGEVVKNDQPTGQIVAAYIYLLIKP